MRKLKKKSVVIIVILLLLMIGGYCYAKYNGSIIQKISALIAKPIFILEGGQSVNIDAVNSEGIYPFIIKNYTQENINEVPLEYTISIDSSELDNCIEYILYEDEKEIYFNGNKTNKIKMKANEKEMNNYKLKIKYNKEKTKETNDIIKNIKIKINSEQIKV